MNRRLLFVLSLCLVAVLSGCSTQPEGSVTTLPTGDARTLNAPSRQTTNGPAAQDSISLYFDLVSTGGHIHSITIDEIADRETMTEYLDPVNLVSTLDPIIAIDELAYRQEMADYQSTLPIFGAMTTWDDYLAATEVASD